MKSGQGWPVMLKSRDRGRDSDEDEVISRTTESSRVIAAVVSSTSLMALLVAAKWAGEYPRTGKLGTAHHPRRAAPHFLARVVA